MFIPNPGADFFSIPDPVFNKKEGKNKLVALPFLVAFPSVHQLFKK
jgi:hypothetical protein